MAVTEGKRLTSVKSEPDCSEAEWRTRVELAACYRQCHKLGITDIIYTHLSARVPDRPSQFLVNANGLLFEEVTASNLVTVDIDGTVVRDATGLGPIPGGYTFHSAVYAARSDAACAFHTHTVAGIAVGAQDQGLLPISQHAARFYERVAYFDYPGFVSGEEERRMLREALGRKPVLMLRNHGVLVVGRDIREAYILTYYLEMACRQQVALQSCNAKFSTIPADIARQTASRFETSDPIRHRDWPALLRALEREDPSFAS